MIILPYVKLGTKPFGSAIVKSKKVAPKEGDIVFIKENNNKNRYDNPWKKVRVDSVQQDVCWFVSLV